MSAVRFYLDADYSRGALAMAVRVQGIDLQTAVEVGLRTASDHEQIAHVLATSRVMITGDHHLREALVDRTRRGDHHPGVLFLPAKRRREFGAILYSIRLVHGASEADEMIDRIEYIPF